MEGEISSNGKRQSILSGLRDEFRAGFKEGSSGSGDVSIESLDKEQSTGDPFVDFADELVTGEAEVSGASSEAALGAAAVLGGVAVAGDRNSDMNRRKFLKGAALTTGGLALASTANGMDLPQNEGVMLVSATNAEKKLKPRRIVSFHPARKPGDMYWQMESLVFESESGTISQPFRVELFSSETQDALWEMVPEIPVGRVSGVGQVRGESGAMESLDLSLLETDEEGQPRDLVAVEYLPGEVLAITAQGEVVGSRAGKIDGPDGEPLQGVRQIQMQGNGKAFIYDNRRRYHIWKPGAKTTQVVAVGELEMERSDHFGAVEMTFVKESADSKIRFNLGLGHVRVESGRLICNFENLDLPNGVTADFDTSALVTEITNRLSITEKRGKEEIPKWNVRSVGTNECGQILVVYENADGQTDPVMFATSVESIEPVEDAYDGEYNNSYEEDPYGHDLEVEQSGETGVSIGRKHLKLKIVKQGFQLQKSSLGRSKIFPNKIDRVVPGGLKGMTLLAQPDAHGDQWAMDIGGRIGFGGSPQDNEEIQSRTYAIGKRDVRLEGGRLAVNNIIPETMDVGGTYALGVSRNTGNMVVIRGSRAGFDSSEPGLGWQIFDFTRTITNPRGRNFIGASAMVITQRKDSSERNGSEPAGMVALEKSGALQLTKGAGGSYMFVAGL